MPEATIPDRFVRIMRLEPLSTAGGSPRQHYLPSHRDPVSIFCHFCQSVAFGRRNCNCGNLIALQILIKISILSETFSTRFVYMLNGRVPESPITTSATLYDNATKPEIKDKSKTKL